MAWPGPAPNTPENRKQMLGRLENPSCFDRRNARAMTATYMLLGRKHIMSYPTVRQTPSTHASSFSGRSLSICCTRLQRHAAVARKCDNETNQPPVGLQSRPMWPVAAVRSMERSVGDQRVVSSQSQFLLETYCAPQERRVQTVQFAGCRLPRKPPPTLCGLRSAVCGLGAASYPPFVVVLGLASLCAYLLARPDKGRCCIVSVSSAHCSSSNLHSSLLLTTLSLETLEPHSTHSRLALLLHACPPASLVTASPPP